MAAVIWEYKTGEITCFSERAEKTYYTFVSKLTVLPMIFVNKIHSNFLRKKCKNGALGPIRTDADFRLSLTRRVQSATMRQEQIFKATFLNQFSK